MYTDFQEIFEAKIKELLPDKVDDILSKIDWDSWIKSPGYPPIKNDFCKK